MEKKHRAVFPTPYRSTEASECIRFRYIYCQCYEIVLPGGVTIVTDPFISGAVDDFTIDDLSGADYIILSHTHFDHDMDTRKIWDKFHGRIICLKEVAMDIAEFFDIPYSNIYAVSENCTYYMPDFTLQTFHGLHDNRKAREGTDKKPSEQGDTTLKRFGIEGHFHLDCMGAMFMMNWVLTTKNNFKIAFHAGQDFDEYVEEVNAELKKRGSLAKAFNPDPYQWYQLYLGIQTC